MNHSITCLSSVKDSTYPARMADALYRDLVDTTDGQALHALVNGSTMNNVCERLDEIVDTFKNAIKALNITNVHADKTLGELLQAPILIGQPFKGVGNWLLNSPEFGTIKRNTKSMIERRKAVRSVTKDSADAAIRRGLEPVKETKNESTSKAA